MATKGSAGVSMRVLVSSVLALGACAMALGAPSGAEAQAEGAILVIRAGGDATHAYDEEAIEAVIDALRESGAEVVPAADVAMRVPPGVLSACEGIACAHEIGGRVGTSRVVALALWAEGERVGAITVSLVRGPELAHAGTANVGEDGVAPAARAALTAARTARARALMAEDIPQAEGRAEPTALEAAIERRDPDAPAPARGLEEYVLPALLGLTGLGLLGIAIYALVDERCERRGALGTCLRGDRPNYGVGIASIVGGSLAVVGAVIWFIVGGETPALEPIDLAVGPDGVALTYRGTL